MGAGKAAARMAAAFEAAWPHECSGLVVTRYGHACPTSRISVAEAGHPTPDEAGVRATREIMRLVSDAREDDLVIALMSGGASSLLVAPARDILLEDKQRITQALLLSGAAIGEMNFVRSGLSAVKAGRLAGLAQPARIITYVISDVPGDDISVVGSGPTMARDIPADAVLEVLAKYGIAVDERLRGAIARAESAQMATGEAILLANARTALEAAAACARELGVEPVILGDDLEGEARRVGDDMASIAQQFAARRWPATAPCVLLSGGETTVTVVSNGRGGRNGEFLLSLALGLNGQKGISALACDTDGIDGSENNAGAWIDQDVLSAGVARGMDARERLARNDSFTYFSELGYLIVTGPTLTNVNDFRAVLIR